MENSSFFMQGDFIMIFYQNKEHNTSKKIPCAPTLSYRCQNNRDWNIYSIQGMCNEVVECTSSSLLNNQLTLGQLIKPSETERVWDSVQHALSLRQPYQVIYNIITPLNTEKTIFDQGEGIFVADKLIELHGFMTDITEHNELIHHADIENYFENLRNEFYVLKNIPKKEEHRLSNKEIYTLAYVCKGMTMKETGNKLNISSRTAEMHFNKIKEKLSCYTRHEIKELFFKTKTGKTIIMLI